MLTKTLLLASLTSLPVPGLAQALPSAARYYVGVGGSLFTTEPFGYQANVLTQLGPAVTVGRHFTPRLALQATVAWQAEVSQFRRDASSAAVLLRYTIAGQATRLRLDGLAGVTFQNYGLLSREYVYKSTTYTLLTLGPAARYALTPRVDLTASVPVLFLADRVNSWDLFLNPQVGVAYSFNH